MSTVKIEHVNPNTANPIAFDVMSAARKDKDGNAVKSTKNPDGTLTYEDGTVVTVDRDGNEIRETMIIPPGHFRVLSLSGGLRLHEVSTAELDERQRKITEREELEAEVARERKSKDDAEYAKKVEEERKEHKAKIEKMVAEQRKDEPVVDRENKWDGKPNEDGTVEDRRPVMREPIPGRFSPPEDYRPVTGEPYVAPSPSEPARQPDAVI